MKFSLHLIEVKFVAFLSRESMENWMFQNSNTTKYLGVMQKQKISFLVSIWCTKLMSSKHQIQQGCWSGWEKGFVNWTLVSITIELRLIGPKYNIYSREITNINFSICISKFSLEANTVSEECTANFFFFLKKS